MAGPTSYCAPGNNSTTAAAIRCAALWRRISSVGSAGAGSGAPASAASSTISSGMGRRFYAVRDCSPRHRTGCWSAGEAGHAGGDILARLAQLVELCLGIEAGGLEVEPQLTQHGDRPRGRATRLVAQALMSRGIDRATLDAAVLRSGLVHMLAASHSRADAAGHGGSL